MTTTTSKTILCPVDFSPSSFIVLKYITERYAQDEELIVWHIDNPGSGEHGTLSEEQLYQFYQYADVLSKSAGRIRFAVEYGTPA